MIGSPAGNTGLFWQVEFCFFIWWANQIFLFKDLRKTLGVASAPAWGILGSGGRELPVCSVDVGLLRDGRQDISSWCSKTPSCVLLKGFLEVKTQIACRTLDHIPL